MAVDMAISATEKPLGKVFTSDYQLTIPSFQRAYTWQAENIEQLVNDLQDACADPDTPYFLGSLILVKDGPTQYQVIDGQQRLISLSIIVSVLRELEDDPDLIDSLNDLILEPGDKLRGIKAEPRLTLRERDTDFFRMYVQEGDLEGLFDLRDNDIASHAQRNIAVNTRRIFDLLAAMDAKDRRRFASYLVNGVTLVIVTTDDLAGAHRIFDVMNMRGVPLTASDVFKAKTIAEISPAARNAYATRWDDIMDPLGDDSHTLEEFFSDLHLIVSHKAVCTQLLEEFRKDVLKPYVKKQTSSPSSTICSPLMPMRGSSSTVRPTPTCQTTSWPCSSHSPTTRPPTGNPWPCGRSSTPSATSAAPTHKCSPHPEISGTKPRTRTTNASNYTTSTDSTTFSPHSNASPASTASTGKAHSPDAHAPQAPSETSTKAIPSNRSVDSSSPTRTDVPHSRIYVANCRPVPP